MFIIRQIKETAIRCNTIAFVRFQDLTKAFDKVKLSEVKLLEQLIPARLGNRIHALNTDYSTRPQEG